MKNYKIIIPVHNEGKYIKKLLENFPAKHKKNIIMVDDGSHDDTAALIKKLAPEVTLLRHKINLGKGRSLETGLLYAKKHGADIVVFMDGDLQHNPNDIDRFLAVFTKKPQTDIVFGARTIGKNMRLIPFLGNKFLTITTNFLFKYFLNDTQCGFRAVKTKHFNKLKWHSSGYQAETEMIINAAKHNLKYEEIIIDTVYMDHYKGTSILDGIIILFMIIKMKLTK